MTIEAIVDALPEAPVGVLGRMRVDRVVRRALGGPLVPGERIRVETRTGPENGVVGSVSPRGHDRSGRERWLATISLEVEGTPRWVTLGSWEDVEWERL